ncbi:DUF255 domain-containing protein [uncultured Roseibium sp.]|uniref:DUF255 domain-containing protein n=1 Tax=uncultured Roseibium sp. TaxID=1936171 RepID=UPI0026140422|nr:DUF255 domain-containing protein [uncultured Roseibium sp.]
MRVLLAICIYLSALICGHAAGFTKVPEQIDPDCRHGSARIYDECTDQLLLFEIAMQRAAKEGKVVLVSYGAEWCIWCHVLNAYLGGEKTKFDYVYADPGEPDEIYEATLYERENRDVSAEAAELNTFVRDHFIVLHIDYFFAPNGDRVLENSGALDHLGDGIPFVFVVNASGKFRAVVDADLAETRRDEDFDWYRGYDRTRLLSSLKKAYQAALQ